MAKAEMNFTRYEGKKIAFKQSGKGQALVLLHGFCSDSRLWEDFTKDWIPNYQLIVIDLPGFGQSEWLPNLSIPSMAGAVKAVLDHLNIATCIMIGHSMGGYVALAFAAHNRTMLKGLGLFHSHPYADKEAKKSERLKSIDFIKRHGTVPYIKQLIPALFAPQAVGSYAFEIEKLSLRAINYPQEVIIASMEAMCQKEDYSAVLHTINCPVLFIIGKDDRVIEHEASLAQTYLPAIADIHILKGVGHMGMLERVQLTRRIIQNFVGNL